MSAERHLCRIVVGEVIQADGAALALLELLDVLISRRQLESFLEEREVGFLCRRVDCW